MTAQLKCPNCGLKGHAPRDCPTKCSVCSHKGCPGNDKIKVRACVCNDKDKPPTAPIKNAAGRDMQPKFVEQLARHHARRFDIEYKKQEASAAQANETQPAESGVGALAGGTAPVSGACGAGGRVRARRAATFLRRKPRHESPILCPFSQGIFNRDIMIASMASWREIMCGT